MTQHKQTYKFPEIHVLEMGENLMLDLNVSNAEVDDEAAKGRNDVEFEDKNWGNVENSLW